MSKEYLTDSNIWPVIQAIDRAIEASRLGDVACEATAIYCNLILDGYKIVTLEENSK